MLSQSQVEYVNNKPVPSLMGVGRVISEEEAEWVIKQHGIETLRNSPWFINRKVSPAELAKKPPMNEPKKKPYQSKWPS